jgi:hypothetical protein
LSPIEAHRSAVVLVLVGALLLWGGLRLFARPLESVESFRRGLGTKRHVPEYLRSRPEKATWALRAQAVFMFALGALMIVGGIMLYVASKK